jgi:hypothetical protein
MQSDIVSLSQYAGMTDEQKLMTVLVKLDNLEKQIMDKPCPSPECLQCRQRIGTLEMWMTKRMAELADEKEIEESESQREAWVVPMWVSVIVSVSAIMISLLVEVST